MDFPRIVAESDQNREILPHMLEFWHSAFFDFNVAADESFIGILGWIFRNFLFSIFQLVLQLKFISKLNYGWMQPVCTFFVGYATVEYIGFCISV